MLSSLRVVIEEAASLVLVVPLSISLLVRSSSAPSGLTPLVVKSNSILDICNRGRVSSVLLLLSHLASMIIVSIIPVDALVYLVCVWKHFWLCSSKHSTLLELCQDSTHPLCVVVHYSTKSLCIFKQLESSSCTWMERLGIKLVFWKRVC